MGPGIEHDLSDHRRRFLSVDVRIGAIARLAGEDGIEQPLSNRKTPLAEAIKIGMS